MKPPRLDSILAPFRGLLAENRALVMRLALYGAAALLLAAGLKIRAVLQVRAAVYDEPYEKVTVFEGDLGSEQLREGLEDSGSDAVEVRAVLAALKAFGGAGRERHGDMYRLVRDADGGFLHLTLNRGKKRVLVVRQGGKFVSSSVDPQVVTRNRTAHGSIRGNLWLSMSREGIPAEVIQEFADVFQWTVDFLTEPRDGDSYAVSWTEERTPDGRVWSRDVSAGLYKGRVAGRAVGVQFDGDFFDEKGDALESMFLRAPLNYRRISSSFSGGRYHPVLRRVRPHHGIDYAAARGTPVVSVGAGRVVFSGRRGGYGNAVEVRHANDFDTLYGHLNSISVRQGAHVRQGQVIGTVGSTGLSTGPHLHFQISKAGRWINFLSMKTQRSRSVPKARRKAFDALLARSIAVLEGDGAPAAR
ncbi:MAG: M23 family metallopeptidase [Elusimicrobia bacterium]|nr:M23 family metallopeptidase [Elusimicrobiota bacterium]